MPATVQRLEKAAIREYENEQLIGQFEVAIAQLAANKDLTPHEREIWVANQNDLRSEMYTRMRNT